jgi:hypothetical protein
MQFSFQSNVRRLAGIAACCVGLSGCAGGFGSFLSTHDQSHLVEGEKVSLTFIKNESELVGDLALLKGKCTPSSPPGAFAMPALVTTLVPLVIDFISSSLTRAIDEYAKSFEATFSGRYVGKYYKDVTPNHRCFRLTRRVKDDVVFDFIGRFDESTLNVANDQVVEAMRIVPEYLYYSGTKARVGSPGVFQAGMTLTLEAIWLDYRKEVKATQSQVFSTILPFGQIDLNDAAVRIPPSDKLPADGSGSGWLIGVPRSIAPNADGKPVYLGSGPFAMTATVIETAAERDLVGEAAAALNSAIKQAAEAAKAKVKE